MSVFISRIKNLPPLGKISVVAAIFAAVSLLILDEEYDQQELYQEHRQHSIITSVPQRALSKRAANYEMMSTSIRADMSELASRDSQSVSESEKKVQITERVELEVENDLVPEILSSLNSYCTRANTCSVQNSNIYVAGAQNIADITLRVSPSLDTDQLLQDVVVDDLVINSRSVSSRDRTSEYIDINARMTSHVVMRDRLMTLLKNDDLTDIENILSVERELARLNGKIDSLKGQLKYIESVTDTNELNISIKGKMAYYREDNSHIMSALNNVANIIELNIAKLITLLASLLVWFIIAGGAWAIWRLIRKAVQRK